MKRSRGETAFKTKRIQPDDAKKFTQDTKVREVPPIPQKERDFLGL